MARRSATAFELLAVEHRSDRIPAIPCPHCRESLASPGEATWDESPETAQYRGHEAWEPEWIRGTFALPFHCGNCGGTARAVGSYRVVEYETERFDLPLDHIELVRFTFVNPPLPLVLVPEDAPDSVRELIAQAAAVWPGSPDATANLARRAVETVLSDHDIPAHEGGRPVSLHQRLRRFALANPIAAAPLEAAKWLGNEGSHSGGLTAAEALTTLTFLGHALELLYEVDDLSEKIARVNAERGVQGLRQ